MMQKNKNDRLMQLKMIVLSAALALFVIGCAQAPVENIALKNAREAYQKAKEDPNVEANAAVPLYEAGKILKNAESATSESQTSHLAYMAEKQTAVAVAIAEQKLAEAEVQKLAKDSDKVLLQQSEQQAQKAQRETRNAQQIAKARGLEAKTAKAQADMLAQELADLKAQKTDRGFVLTLGDVLFATGKADLMPGAQKANDQLAAFLHKYPTKTVSVEGHTDSMGSEQYNIMLSQNRALSVRSAIMARGINSDRITAKGLGELYPVASNDTSAGRQQNRRVEILIQSVE
jgi:outer membrane protein OmpA-like peptidoglycan-associated protein